MYFMITTALALCFGFTLCADCPEICLMFAIPLFIMVFIVPLAMESRTKQGRDNARRRHEQQVKYENEYGIIKSKDKKK